MRAAAASWPGSPMAWDAQLRHSWSSCMKMSKGLLAPGMTATEGPTGISAQPASSNADATRAGVFPSSRSVQGRCMADGGGSQGLG
jgi:hypothetical protein